MTQMSTVDFRPMFTGTGNDASAFVTPAIETGLRISHLDQWTPADSATAGLTWICLQDAPIRARAV